MANTFTVVGNLAKDPEIRYTQNGKPVTSFTMADTPRSLNPATNEWEDGTTLWLSVTAWDALAENVAASLAKGMRVVVTGSLTQKNYTTKDGQERIQLEIKANEVAPSLRFATATVTKKTGGGSSSSNSSPAVGSQETETEPF